MKTSHVVAVGTNRVIGLNGQLPWHAPSDLKHFKSVTMGKILLMGRKTFDSVGKPLPGRMNLVITSQPELFRNRETERLKFFGSIKEAYAFAKTVAHQWKDELCIVGGGEIYKQSFHLLDHIFITVIAYDGPGDATYPEIPSKDFFVKECRILSQENVMNEPRSELFIYERTPTLGSQSSTPENNQEVAPIPHGSDPSQLSRRHFLGQVTGYAVSMCPVSALAITTSGEGLVSELTSVETDDKKVMAVYRAYPQKKNPKGIVLVIQEIFGLHEYIRDVCRRLAKEGYAAFAPDLYFRQGDATKLTSIDSIREQIVSKVSQTQVLKDLDHTLALAQKQFPKAPPFVTGFCWGGSMTWLYCDYQPKIKSGVAWYGRLKMEKSQLNPREPLEVPPSLKVPVLGLYGELDKSIPLEQVDEMNQKLKKSSSPGSSIKVFKKADHGFHADYRPTYAPEAAQEGWGDMLHWFEKHQ
jgi:carboxymethylenebutenolidase